MADYVTAACAAVDSAMTNAKLKKEMGQWDEAEKQWHRALKIAQEVIGSGEEIPLESLEKLRDTFDEIRYNLAFVCFRKNDDDEAVSLLLDGEISLLKEEILLGSCLLTLGLNSTEVKLIEDAYECLRVLEQKEDELRREGFDSMDETLLLVGYLKLALLYRMGMGGAPKDLERAYRVLERGLSMLQDNFCIEKLDEEMSRYSKKLFGGLTYKEK